MSCKRRSWLALQLLQLQHRRIWRPTPASALHVACNLQQVVLYLCRLLAVHPPAHSSFPRRRAGMLLISCLLTCVRSTSHSHSVISK